MMKRYLIIGIIATALAVLFLCWPRRDADAGASSTSEPPSPALPSKSPGPELRATRDTEQNKATIQSTADTTNREDQLETLVRKAAEAGNIPVSFYGLVVDQDTNPLSGVTVHLAVTEESVDSSSPFQTQSKATPLLKQTGADGRFEVTGLKGKYIGIETLTKEGYEQELPGQACGLYGAQSTSFLTPAFLRMWSTNLHEPLVSGEKSFVIVPDGRHYAIDVLKGVIAEGEEGDLVTWIKRPEKVLPRQRYGWSCELAVPGGGLLDSKSKTMFFAPDAGYTNTFAFEQQADVEGWGDGFERKLFYVKLQRGQMYGRVSVDLYADCRGKYPAMIRLSYAVNPSGSRLLR